jgi:hypothetical protein
MKTGKPTAGAGDAFSRADFEDFSGRDEVGRLLKVVR